MSEQIDNKIGSFSFRIHEIKTLSFTENELSQFKIKELSAKKIENEISFRFGVEKKDEVYQVDLYFEFKTLYKQNKKKILLFGIKTVHSYIVKSTEKNLFTIKDDSFSAPEELLFPLLNISIGGTRGILSEKISTPEYKQLYIPIVSPKNLLNSAINS